MIPDVIIRYLKQADIPFQRLPHRYAVSAQELAASLHISGHRVAKSVLIEADGKKWLVVLPAAENIDFYRLAEVLGTREMRFLSKDEFAPIFQGCEAGSVPPFGRLYGLPVIMEASLLRGERLVFSAGSYREAIELKCSDFLALEEPLTTSFREEPLPYPYEAQSEAYL